MARTSKYKSIEKASQKSTVWNAGLYVRLSREDGDKSESESIVSQKTIISDFLSARNDINAVDFYVDDGWSGTDFERPGFRRMLDDIRNKTINCVIVKDLSRFGRNYVEAGKYLEVVFPASKVRFIAVNDNIDSVGDPSSVNSVIVPFKNIINDEYCRDISAKVRSALDSRRRQGKFIGSFAVYGYKKDAADHSKLVIDEEAAETVRLIFAKFLAGNSIIGIARFLNANGVDCPSAYKRKKGMRYNRPAASGDGLWSDSSVRRILTSEMYIGNMVQKKNETVSYKVRLSRGVPKEKWIVVEGTHEPIIAKEDFIKAQSLLGRDMRISPKSGKLSLFAGFLKCPDCGRALQKRTVIQPYRTYAYYACGTYRKMHSGACTKHMIREDVLEEAVRETLNKYIRLAVDFESLIESINSSPAAARSSERLKSLIAEKEREISEAERILVDLYPDFKRGLLSREQYLALKERYENAIEKAKNSIAETQKQLSEAVRGIENNEFVSAFLKLRGFKELSREILTELVDVIYVHEGGAVEIHLKCRDAFLLAAEYVDSKGRLASGREKGSGNAL